MHKDGKFKVGLHCFHSRKTLVFVSLLFMMTLTFSCFILEFKNGVSPFVLSASDKVVVGNETELRNAINNAVGSTIITFSKDITLTETVLTIPVNKEITLTSNKVSGFYKLIGVVNRYTIVVDSGGALTLDGIIITHKSGELGGGVTVSKNGTLSMFNGEITGNIGGYYWSHDYYGREQEAIAAGGGVANGGVFKMSGGSISNNLKFFDGGGVTNGGTFILSGGEITGNTASSGGGVYNSWPSVFEMTGGKIAKNNATATHMYGGGGGVSIGGSYTEKCVFVMSGGEITGNTAPAGDGGGVHNHGGKFTLAGGKISGNTAYTGGGVYGYAHIFEWVGGEISGNTFTGTYGSGANVYPENSNGLYSGDGGSSNGNNGGSSNGNNGSTGGNSGGFSNGDGGVSEGDGYSLKDVIIICVGVVGLAVGVVAGALLVYFQKKIAQVEAKISTHHKINWRNKM